VENNKIHPKRCPVCNAQTNYVYRIQDAATDIERDFFRCQCGIVFQENFPEEFQGTVYDEKYIKGYEGGYKPSILHGIYTYGNLIEELTYGRTMLDVGMATPFIIKEWERRGWVTYGIDINNNIKAGGNVYQGNFENYDFNLKLTPELEKTLGGMKLNPRKFDMIWMNHVLEHFKDPVKALEKAYGLLSETGVLSIAVPDADFIFKTGVSGYGHWKPKEHYVLWTESTLVKELERIGFNVIMKRRNFSSRFMSWYDVHVICQKRYF
jgi:predicted SAM-dependent methyltransferase